jgi:hypothetical protein
MQGVDPRQKTRSSLLVTVLKKKAGTSRFLKSMIVQMPRVHDTGTMELV